MAILRDTHPADLPDLLRIYNWAVLHTTATFDLEEQTLEQRTAWFSKYGKNYPLIVAEEDGKVVGYSCISPFREKPAYAKTVELSVYIDKNYWGKGIGKLLVGEIITRARQLGYHTILAGITGDNETSIKLHERFGFRLVARFAEVGYKFGAWRDVLFYQLML
ncbi:MAG: N-acetyltransferase [Thermicanus sp.]|nr:N-acetyltransferase [Thermicanus sp.]